MTLRWGARSPCRPPPPADRCAPLWSTRWVGHGRRIRGRRGTGPVCLGRRTCRVVRLGPHRAWARGDVLGIGAGPDVSPVSGRRQTPSLRGWASSRKSPRDGGFCTLVRCQGPFGPDAASAWPTSSAPSTRPPQVDQNGMGRGVVSMLKRWADTGRCKAQIVDFMVSESPAQDDPGATPRKVTRLRGSPGGSGPPTPGRARRTPAAPGPRTRRPRCPVPGSASRGRSRSW